MPFTPEQKREIRALEKVRKNLVPQFYETAVARDTIAGKNRFKSEVLDQLSLAKMFTGVEWKETQEEDDRRTSPANKKKKKVINPSAHGFFGAEKPVHDTIEDLQAAFDNWLALRDRARKDLFWLCEILGKDVIPEVHQVVCDQFVK
jgi:hypothetical protein